MALHADFATSLQAVNIRADMHHALRPSRSLDASEVHRSGWIALPESYNDPAEVYDG